ncbi:MAG: SMP-30/gluconolactonase/LRE family protein [Gemmatimonadetes bacterium]|nr:SMP-30/gluconolactonase/LRE family protein [Gemmatimonadota bacterium]
MARPVGSADDIRLLASGLEWPAGPRYGPDGLLYVANFASARGLISRVTPDGTVSAFVETGGAPNGLAFGPDGVLYVADAGRRAVLRVGPSGDVSVFADSYEGARFNGPNDLVFGPNGDLFVTDPLRHEPPDPCISPVYRIAPDGRVFVFAGEIPYPEGVAVSPDGSEVFVAEMRSNRLLAFPLRPGRSAGEPRMVYRFRDPGWPVGMVVDEEGTIIVAVYRAGALAFVSQQGELLERWERPGSMPTDIGLGGPDGRTVYVTDAAGKVETFQHGARGL